MRAMKDSGISYIGEIPQDWELKPLGIYFSEVNTKNFDLEKTIALQFKVGEIIAKPNQKENLTEEDKALLSGYTKVEPNDIIINGLNLNYDFKSLRVARSKMDGAMTSAYIFIRKRDNEDSSYFNYLLKAYDAQKVLHGMGDGIRLTLKFDELKKILVPALTNSEQRGIAAFLDNKCAEVDELLNVQEQFIEELKNYKQALITETVTKGLKTNTKTKQSGIEWIGEIPEGWRVLPIKSIYQFGKGLGITKADLIDKGIPVISYGQIHSKQCNGVHITDDLIRYVSQDYLETDKSSLVKTGDVIFADTSEDLDGCGNCIYIDRNIKMFAGYHTIIASLYNGKGATKYLAYLFQTDCWRKQIRTEVNGVKLFSISQRLLSSTSVIVPPLAEQEEIAAYLDQKCAEIDQLIAIKQQKAEELREYRKSLIYEYVTGKKQL